MIRRLKRVGTSEENLLDIYCKQIRSILEFAAPVWNPGLTGEDIVNLERIQKTVFHIIMGEEYTSYNYSLTRMGSLKLSDRREKITNPFAKKALKNPKFANWFRQNPKVGGKTKQPEFCPVVAKTVNSRKHQ